jgi:hypothetical protein
MMGQQAVLSLMYEEPSKKLSNTTENKREKKKEKKNRNVDNKPVAKYYIYLINAHNTSTTKLLPIIFII